MIFCCGWQVVCFKPKPINSFNLHNAKWNTLAAKIVLYLENRCLTPINTGAQPYTDKPMLSRYKWNWQLHQYTVYLKRNSPLSHDLQNNISAISSRGKQILKKDNHWTFQYLKKKYNIELLKTYVKCSIYIFYFIFIQNVTCRVHMHILSSIYLHWHVHACISI